MNEQWTAFVDAFHAKNGRWPTASEVELGMGQRVTPIRVTAPRTTTATTPGPREREER